MRRDVCVEQETPPERIRIGLYAFENQLGGGLPPHADRIDGISRQAVPQPSTIPHLGARRTAVPRQRRRQVPCRAGVANFTFVDSSDVCRVYARYGRFTAGCRVFFGAQDFGEVKGPAQNVHGVKFGVGRETGNWRKGAFGRLSSFRLSASGTCWTRIVISIFYVDFSLGYSSSNATSYMFTKHSIQAKSFFA